MKRIIFLIVAVLVVLFFVVFSYYQKNVSGILTAISPASTNIQEVVKKGVNNTDFSINVPDDYQLSIFNDRLTKPRVLIKDPQNRVLVSDISENAVYFITPNSRAVVASNLNKPHGLVFDCDQNCFLYIADQDGVYKYDYDQENALATNKQLFANIPQGGRHFTKSLLIQNDKLFISVGSSCDTCIEKDERIATVLVSNLDGSDLKVFASGLRNAVFIDSRPETDEIWVTEMGRDFLGDNLPPDEINILKEGGFYGWPYCYGQNVLDKTFDQTKQSICDTAIPAHYELQAHSAPLGLEFLDKNTLLVSYHGSWNRSEPTGYKIVKLTLNKDGTVTSEEDFLTGWLNENGEAIGRPVDILKIGDDIYISDDKAGVVYKLEKI